jgi:hypothetical protein
MFSAETEADVTEFLHFEGDKRVFQDLRRKGSVSGIGGEDRRLPGVDDREERMEGLGEGFGEGFGEEWREHWAEMDP